MAPDNENEALVLFSRAWGEGNTQSLKTELASALANAARSGVTLDFICGQLMSGISKLSYEGGKNIGAPPAEDNMTRAQRQIAELGFSAGSANVSTINKPALDCLNQMLAGNFANNNSKLKLALLRLLRPWLTPGPGTSCKIEINVEKPSQCWSDGTTNKRYPTLSLVHELVHAWRFASGLMLVPYADKATFGGFDIEELIATGAAPYNYEKYSENFFRAQFTEEKVGMRTAY